MSFLDTLPLIGKWFDKGLDLADQAIIDKDKMSELISHLEDGRQTIGKEIYLKELETRTVPWVDALHKMGRQNLNLITILLTFNLLMCGVEISFEAMTLLGGGNVAYQLIKGKGKNK